MTTARWVFNDALEGETYVFYVNPNKGGSPQYMKNMGYQSTAAPDGQTIAYEGRDQPNTSEFAGVILTQAQYDAMVHWFSKRHVISYTDDLGRQFDIYITSFEPQRERAVHYPWKHSYTVKYLILAITEGVITPGPDTVVSPNVMLRQ